MQLLAAGKDPNVPTRLDGGKGGEDCPYCDTQLIKGYTRCPNQECRRDLAMWLEDLATANREPAAADKPLARAELIEALRLPGAHGPAEYALNRVAERLEMKRNG